MTDDWPKIIIHADRMTIGVVTYDDYMAEIRWLNPRKPSLTAALLDREVTEIPRDVLRARIDDKYYIDYDELLYRILQS